MSQQLPKNWQAWSHWSEWAKGQLPQGNQEGHNEQPVHQWVALPIGQYDAYYDELTSAARALIRLLDESEERHPARCSPFDLLQAERSARGAQPGAA